MADRRLCPHGNRRDLGSCPACHNEALAKRQRRVDRIHWRARLRTIRGR